jgi:hypothetical protein
LAELVRGELRLAQAEMKEKGQRYGKGGDLFGGAGVVGFLMSQALAATAIAPAAVALPARGRHTSTASATSSTTAPVAGPACGFPTVRDGLRLLLEVEPGRDRHLHP